MVKIIWSNHFFQKTTEICDYISIESPEYASKFLTLLETNINNLEKFPKMGRIVPERNIDDLRELILGNYRIIYHLCMDNENIELITIIHSKQRFGL